MTPRSLREFLAQNPGVTVGPTVRLPFVWKKKYRDEAAFQADVIKCGMWYGWDLVYHTHDSRRSQPGFPDLILGRTRPVPEMVVPELKMPGNTPSDAQKRWLAFFAALGHKTAVWYPKDVAEIEAVLSIRSWT